MTAGTRPVGPAGWAAVLLAAAIAVPAGLGFLGSTWPVLDLFAHFRLHYALLLLVPLAVAAASRRWRMTGAVALLAVPNAVALGAAWMGPPTRPTAEADLSIVALNVLASNRSFEATRDYLLETDADVVVLQEVNEAWLAALRPVRDRYPEYREHPRVDNFGIAVFSRFPWSDLRPIPAGRSSLPMVRATVQTPAGPVDLLALHLVPPLGARYREMQDEQLDAARAALHSAEHPVLVVGDLNATPWSHVFRRLTAETDLQRSATRGLHATWPAAFGRFGIPLDHALHTPRLEPLAYEIGPDVGSDHRPVFVRYRVAGPR